MQPKQTEVSTKQNKKTKKQTETKITGLTCFKIFTKPAEEEKKTKTSYKSPRVGELSRSGFPRGNRLRSNCS